MNTTTTSATPRHIDNKEPLLRIQSLGVNFGSLAAVKDVSFNAHAGKITAVIGPNGAGKSSLFNLISGAIRPSSGQVLFDGVT